MSLYKLEGDVIFARKADELSVKGGYLFLLDELEGLDGIWIKYNRMVIKLSKNVNAMVVQAGVGDDPEGMFNSYWSKFLDQKVNLLHLVFGHRIAREESLYDDLSLIIRLLLVSIPSIVILVSSRQLSRIC